MYDAIVIGARVAGSAAAMLLARQGYRVLVVDRAAFPSDTLSTHQVQLPGIARLKRWGLLDQVAATNAPATRRVRLDQGPLVVEGTYPLFDGVDAMYSPRRIYLDKILVDAAVAAGAELRENFVVDELLWEGDTVTGVRGHAKSGAEITDLARIVIGADGRHSLVAKSVNPLAYHEKPALSFAYYSYFSGISMAGGEMYARPHRALGVWPTNDGLTMIYVAGPVEEFPQFRADLEANYMDAVDQAGSLGERVRAGMREERIFGSADLPNYYRKPYGPGWALVGDAGYLKDPITGAGISDAFRDAELLAHALDLVFSGNCPAEEALHDYEVQRNAASKAQYDFTIQLASFAPPPPEQIQLFEALSRNPAAASQFFGLLAGAVPYQKFFAPDNLVRILGLGGMAKMTLRRVREAVRPRSSAAAAHSA